MAAYEYKALDSKGKNKKGIVEADSVKQVRQQLREKGLVPLEVKVTAQKEKNRGGIFQAKISASDLALITRQIATLVQSALPIEASLLAVAEQCEKPRMKGMLMGVRSKVVEGYSLAEGLGEFPYTFDNLFCSMVAAGEKSGHLDQVLERLADYTEQRQHMRSQLSQAMMYPMILTTFAVAIISILLATVVPQIVGQFENMNQTLPGTTLFLIDCSDFIRNYGLFLLLGIVMLVVLIKRLLLRPNIRMRYDRILLDLPVIGKVSKGVNTARFARTLSILTSSAVPLLEGMQISGKVLENQHIKKAIMEAAMRVREGAGLKVSLESTKIFPPMMLHMIASGEKSGELENMLGRAADNQDRDFEMRMNISLKIFEPVLVAVMAGMVLFIVMAILQPILNLNNMVGI
ncbi:MAG: general secretion pathway protein F [Phenylobacterium sp.]|jgi:general secretion pathway protein F